MKNLWDTTRVAGGSSGGSAAAVSARMAAFSIGEDTGGSIRNPASMCNIAGLKVTYGRVSRYGAIAYASSLDTVGPMAKRVIAGVDPKDATSSRREVPHYSTLLEKPLSGMRVGIPKEFFAEGLTPEVRDIFVKATRMLESLGAQTLEVSLPSLPFGVSIYYLIAMSETSSNLNRYDGVRFGNNPSFFGEEGMRRIIIGTYALKAGYHDDLYGRALKGRTMLIREFDALWETCDVLLGPTIPTLPNKLGDLSENTMSAYLADAFTAPVSLVGSPSLAIPAGFSKSGLPVGMQIIGRKFDEATILAVGHAYQKATDWHKKKPALLS